MTKTTHTPDPAYAAKGARIAATIYLAGVISGWLAALWFLHCTA
jgi:hypothetical protein